MSELADVFSPEGLLASHLAGFSYREPQARMAELVGRAIGRGEHAVLEAGTGIGKTFAYVVPILLSGQSAIISTGTKTLQDQLFARDLPALGRALGRPVDVALLKGRANYLCWHRLKAAREDGRLKASLRSDIDSIARWGRTSDSGDLTEIGDLEEDFRLKARVTSTIDNCLGSQCEEIEDCFVLKARRRAQAATVVIVNHHLLLADLSLKQAGFGELLPGVDCVVVDEAHLLPEIAQQFFDVSVSSRQLTRLGHDIVDEAHSAGVGRELEGDALALAKGVASLVPEAGRMAGRRPGVPSRLESELAGFGENLNALADKLEGFEADAGLARCRERCLEAAARLDQVLKGDLEEGLKWFDASEQSFAAHFTPFDVGRLLAERFADQGGSWVFTSASLAVGEEFSHFNDRLGIEPDIEAALPSPFDYENQAALYLPPDLPEPSDPEHTELLLAAVYPLIEAAGGGVFALFTSHRALATAERWFSQRRLPGPLFVQGAGARSRLLDDFRRAGSGVLLGTGSFWQGVDVKGPALRMVVIDKLPFAVPSDPLVQARIEAIRRRGGDAFSGFQLPEAVLALKQGVGRLIRDFDDRGMVVLGDPRLRSKGYGPVFLNSLPPFAQLDDPAAAARFAASLNVAAEAMTA
ncbi:MAG: ATP-dependent DNA helicase [Gammaproteobacteria bacterium]|jgi:ATP-dependent DNA helicase DinG